MSENEPNLVLVVNKNRQDWNNSHDVQGQGFIQAFSILAIIKIFVRGSASRSPVGTLYVTIKVILNATHSLEKRSQHFLTINH